MKECLIFKINEKTYLVDSIKKELVEVKKEKMVKKFLYLIRQKICIHIMDDKMWCFSNKK